MSDAARHAEAVRDGIAGVTPSDGQVAQILARTAEAPLLPLGDQLFQRLLQHRIVFLGQQVDDDIANRIAAEIILLAAEDRIRDISLYINSPGGSVSAGLAIYDVMQYVTNDVATYAMGMAASMGQFLLCAGTPGKRYALPHAQILMHQGSAGFGGTAADVEIYADQLERFRSSGRGRRPRPPGPICATSGIRPRYRQDTARAHPRDGDFARSVAASPGIL